MIIGDIESILEVIRAYCLLVDLTGMYEYSILCLTAKHLNNRIGVEKGEKAMQFPVMQYDTKYGIDFRVGATEANIRSGSALVGYIVADTKVGAIRKLKAHLKTQVDKLINR